MDKPYDIITEIKSENEVRVTGTNRDPLSPSMAVTVMLVTIDGKLSPKPVTKYRFSHLSIPGFKEKMVLYSKGILLLKRHTTGCRTVVRS